MKPWRLILSPPSDGATNMAIDEAFFRLCAPPTLRFYSWSRPTLSLGYFQKADKGLIGRCNKAGVELVRRSTGGRAVLHHNDITYSVCSTYDDFPAPSTLTGVYKTLALWQITSFESVGIKVLLGDRRGSHSGYTKKGACFLTSTPYELLLSGKKVCGSAQKRGQLSFMQHGSIPLEMDMELLSYLTGENVEEFDVFTTLRGEGYNGSTDDLIETMIQNFEEIVGSKLKKSILSQSEIEESRRLKGCYRHPFDLDF